MYRFTHLIIKELNIDVNLTKKFETKGNNDERSEFIKNLLHIAVENENIELIQILLESSNIYINSLASYWSKRYFGYTYRIFKSEKNCFTYCF